MAVAVAEVGRVVPEAAVAAAAAATAAAVKEGLCSSRQSSQSGTRTPTPSH